MMQNLNSFKLPDGFRGRSAIIVQLWWLIQDTFFRWSPDFMYGWRNWLLRLFGAKIGKGVRFRPTVTITYPWKVTIGDYSWIGQNVVLYSLGEIEIGSHVSISERSYICTASHDYTQSDFPIFAKKTCIGAQSWLATDVFLAPGVSIGEGAVIGARSSVYSDMPKKMVCFGNPCKPIKVRESSESSAITEDREFSESSKFTK
jgi:putative colanic acid biosynthesis acetyltransferase WcaF